MPAKSGRGGADVPGVKTNEREGTRAVLRHSRLSASKVRQVLNLIRDQDVTLAGEILANGDREAATVVGKVLASPVANAAHNDGLDAEELFVSACYADEGTTLKRWRPRARGPAAEDTTEPTDAGVDETEALETTTDTEDTGTGSSTETDTEAEVTGTDEVAAEATDGESADDTDGDTAEEK